MYWQAKLCMSVLSAVWSVAWGLVLYAIHRQDSPGITNDLSGTSCYVYVPAAVFLRISS